MVCSEVTPWSAAYSLPLAEKASSHAWLSTTTSSLDCFFSPASTHEPLVSPLDGISIALEGSTEDRANAHGSVELEQATRASQVSAAGS